MKKADFDRRFIYYISSHLHIFAENNSLDKPAVSMEYTIIRNNMAKEGQITEEQRMNWCTPNGALSLKYLKSKKLKHEKSD